MNIINTYKSASEINPFNAVGYFPMHQVPKNIEMKLVDFLLQISRSVTSAKFLTAKVNRGKLD